MTNRRNFLKNASLATAALGLGLPQLSFSMNRADVPFKISLAEWSLNRLIFGKQLDHLDFPLEAKKHGIHAVEYVNQFFMDKAQDMAYLKEMNTRCENEGITQVLIMVDREGMLGARSESDRMKAVDNHKKWIEAAKFLGCHTVRVNGYSDIAWSQNPADAAEASKLVSDGIRKVCEFAEPHGIHIVIENHGGFSSNGKWLAETIRNADHPLAGTLPDFGNFRISTVDGKAISYDSYRGVDELMPLATGVSLKPKVWDDAGNEYDLDYERMMKIVLSHNYHGHVGIEHGEKDREWESIVEIREILEKLQKSM
ncbi:TIM barrel protein [Algoriphagus sp. CAU 1675]|uniref:TIM barrel protein n=1 Tax=Algoriphagus sp. CAU 1675 TaxID=3032597 RepID=UPI0023DB93BC|nr:TIM barrel protein [Algoriphagus sp. CAU 1675]MDF2156798.1 TIM barrel protein [Algoriphagus sp. CAU 1675]